MTPRPIEVRWDQSEDLSRFRTWDWVDGDAVFVRAPFGDAAQIKEQLSDRVARGLRERGLERVHLDAELRVAAVLVGTRSYQVLRRGRAMQTLHSHHDIGGFEVQSDEIERRALDRCRVAIFLTGARHERMIWQGVWDQRRSEDCTRHLDEAVAALLERFPPRSADGARGTRSQVWAFDR